ncbi:hypothetical protein EMIT0P265_190005 [Pseudomonas zeae]
MRRFTKILDRAYGAILPLELPSSFKPIVGDAAWVEAEGQASFNASVLEVELGDAKILAGAASASTSLTHRWLPYRLWMAPPHTVLHMLADGNTSFGRDLLNQVRTADPTVAAYLDKIGVTGVTQLKQDCSGQLIPDTTLSFSSACAGASPLLNWCGLIQLYRCIR